MLNDKLVSAPIVVAPNWSFPFELMCDARDFAGQCWGRNEKFFPGNLLCDSCHSRVTRNQQYFYPKFPPTVVVKLLQYSDSRVEHRVGFSLHK